MGFLGEIWRKRTVSHNIPLVILQNKESGSRVFLYIFLWKVRLSDFRAFSTIVLIREFAKCFKISFDVERGNGNVRFF